MSRKDRIRSAVRKNYAKAALSESKEGWIDADFSRLFQNTPLMPAVGKRIIIRPPLATKRLCPDTKPGFLLVMPTKKWIVACLRDLASNRQCGE
jgi:hypothetical protein